MTLISRQVSEVSQVSLGRTNSSLTAEAPAPGAPTFLAFAVARKGEPGVPLLVNKDNLATKLGKPYHMRESVLAEGLRHVADAVEGGPGYVFRVMASDAKAPVIKVAKKTAGAPVNDPNPAVASTIAYHTEPTLGADDIFAIYLIDGDNENPRHISAQPADTSQYGAGYWELVLLQTDTATSQEIELERHIVAFNLTAVDVGGRPAFIEDKLSRESVRMRAKANPTMLAQFVKMNKTAFAGGTSGTLANVDAAAFDAAISAARRSSIIWSHIIAAGIYDDTVLGKLKTLGYDSATTLLADVEPNLSYTAAVARAGTLAMNSEYVRLYHCPFTFEDAVYGTRINCGISGIAFRAQALAVANNVIVGAWHIPGAGETRGYISRKAMVLNKNAGDIDEVAFVKARLNKVAFMDGGGLAIDDNLTTFTQQTDLRFGWVAETVSAIDRAWARFAKTVKHEGEADVIDALTKGTTRLLENFKDAKALVTPQDPENGTEPYVFSIQKVATDHFHCQWDLCVAGAARRISGQGRLLK